MQLTLYADYSLRVLLFLGLQPDLLSTINEIADSYHISRNHLVKVVHNLGQLGYINTTRGRNGGMSLAHSPEAINIGEVVRKTEVSFDLVECFNMDSNTCPIAPVCALKTALLEAQRAFLKVLDGYTLADVLKNKKDLALLLRIAP
jgi:Rrf2 family nitric oxide-sensitive transcriptional repressor